MSHLNFILLGLGSGAVFAALAVSLVTTYRSSGVVNFATGAIALHAAYTYAFLRLGKLLVPIPGLPKTIDVGGPVALAPAIVLTLLIEALVGIFLYLVVFRPLRNHVPVAKAVASLGVMVVFTAVMYFQVGGDQVLVKPILPRTTWFLGDIRIISDRLWFVLLIVGMSLLLGGIYKFTRFGMATRAAAETEVGALVSGLSPERSSVANWAISAMVAAIAGIFIAPLVPLVPGTYTLFIVPALAAAVLGRFSSLALAVAGGLLIGVMQAEAVFLQSKYTWFPGTGVPELIPLVIVLAVLVVRGRPLPTRGTLLEKTLGRAPRPHSVLRPVLIGLPLGVLALYTLNYTYRAALMESMIYAVISLSIVVITGYVGQVSLAQLTLAGAAAFLLSRFSDEWGIPFPFAPILAAAGAMVVGVLVGLPALRIRGMLVAVVTLIFAVAVEALWFRNNDFNGGVSGARVANPSLFGIDLGIGSGTEYPRPEYGLLCLATLTAVAVGVAKLRTSRLGSAMLAVRANERSAAAAGINVVRIKMTGFAIGAFIAGLGGCLLAYKQTIVSFQSYDVLTGLLLFATAYLAGATSVSGGLLAGLLSVGGLAFVFFSKAVDVGRWYGILSGVGLIITVIQHPDGLVGTAHSRIDRRRQAAIASARVGTRAEPAHATWSLSRPATSNGAPVLSLARLQVSYGGVLAVDDVNLDVPPGSIVGIIGPNGAGKTTLMDAVCGFTRYQGKVMLEGKDLAGLPPHARARLGLARTFQGLDLYNDLSVEENVVVGQYVRKHDAPELTVVLGLLGLDEVRERNVGELSQGQRQLVSVARALAGGPGLLLLDEPAAGLDTSESTWLADRLRVVRDNGVTIVLVDHDMHFVMQLCDSIHVLDFGRQIAFGSPAEIRASSVVAEAYLGSTHAEKVAVQ